MSNEEFKEYINKTLGNSIRCLLPSYWWKRLFGLVVDKIDEVDGKVAKLPTKSYVTNAIGGKQDTLVSGVNIKTINGEDILGEGDITISISKNILYCSKGDLPEDLRQHNSALIAQYGYNIINKENEFCVYQNDFSKTVNIDLLFRDDYTGGYYVVCTLWRDYETPNRYKSLIHFKTDGTCEIKAYRNQNEVIRIPELKPEDDCLGAFLNAGFTYGEDFTSFSFGGRLAFYLKIKVVSGLGRITVLSRDDYNALWETTINAKFDGELNIYYEITDKCLFGGVLAIGDNLPESYVEHNKIMLRWNLLETSVTFIHSEYGLVSPLRVKRGSDSSYLDIIIFNNTKEQLETWRISASDGTSALVTEDTLQFATKQEVIDNEEVTVVAFNEIDSRIKSISENVSDITNEFRLAINKINSESITNEEIIANALTNLNSRIDEIITRIESFESNN